MNITAPEDTKKRKPVIVYIYGEAFTWGTSNLPYDGSKFVKNGDVIFVTINYRLWSFGFVRLSPYANGYSDNVGLLDQLAALSWVQKNIEFFGGDPEKVTVMDNQRVQ